MNPLLITHYESNADKPIPPKKNAVPLLLLLGNVLAFAVAAYLLS